MFDTAFIDTNNFDTIYSTSFKDVKSHYEKIYNGSTNLDSEVISSIPSAKLASLMISGLKEIVYDLNYDKEKFENLIFTLDDDYDLISNYIKNLNKNIESHNELLKLTDVILDDIMIVQRELGFIISNHENS